ncbi:Hsp20/alpha crystallin family protein [Candidatus Woesebacteria bacterium]|nr:Hsp20/alpha crystallin family protein [Candidatus Woesebacteria bacterium]
MTNIRLVSPLSRLLYRPMMQDWEEHWPTMTMTDGIDVYEEGDKVCVKAPVPGIPAENVDIEFENGVLRIKARYEEKQEEKDKKRVVYKQERISAFEYTTTLPRPVDAKSIEAEVVDGVLKVTATIAEEAKPKKIPVKVQKEK